MRIGAILRRWIEILATLYLAWCESRRELRSLMVTRENGHVVVRHAEPARGAMLRDGQAGNVVAILPPGAEVSADLSRVAHNSFVVLEFPADKVVMRHITVPAQARKFLAGVIRNQIERLSPWPANGVVYGFVAEAGAENAAVVEVRILMTARADVDVARQELAARGLPVDRIVARGIDTEATDETAARVTLWSRLADTSPERHGSLVRAIGIGIAASVAASHLLGSWALLSAASIRDESEEVAARSRALQRQVQTGRTAASMASMPPAERAWVLKETSVSSAILMEALSRALPDAAYLNEIRLEKESLRIMGLADDAPALLAPLERSDHLTDVHFFAPTARGPDGKLFRFSIEAHVEPRIKIGEEGNAEARP
jgi:general secretion pathway protein L